MTNHLITLRQEGCTSIIGHVALPAYPVAGDVVVDQGDVPWVVTGRTWHHEVGLTLVCRRPRA